MSVKESIITQISQQVKDKTFDTGALVYNIIEAAATYFEECPEDFCLQNFNGYDCFVFGGTNRLIWTPLRGFKPDPSYCTKQFLDHATKV